MVLNQRKMKQIAIFVICLILVLGLYKSIVNTEDERFFFSNPLQHFKQSGDAQTNIKSRPEAATGSTIDLPRIDIRDLQEANERIRNLEGKLMHIETKIENQVLKSFPVITFLNYKNRKRILVTGGAGFVGSHLVDRLMIAGHEVIVVDNFFTGRKRNVEHWVGHENFELVHHDIIRPLYLEVDEIYHLASPASPPHYMMNPVKTIKTNTLGTINMLGPRACYDEGKRVSETLSYAYMRQEGVPIRIARIFNTFGPRMHMNDGRVVSNFILQALQNDSITIYGNGKQTRSFQYVSDLVDGLMALMASNYSQPVNIGNPVEHTIEEFAFIIKDLVGGTSTIVELAAMEDDPQRRKPDISRAKKYLNWEPKVPLAIGLKKTITYFEKELQRTKHYQKDVKQPALKNDHDIIEQL
ncbi:UDP-glucuronic acid decarboxylase 1 isoform X2 [Belonocnema kinseyi]|uniref:UDP-glucuronic acid decarboxylase 1 isoform X2 n=1 Tax=Belonocnema kinseyi TaxID=2817044 RepID=UPI00143DE7C5|nr:UDP-glucuronic acid decarboxylase 1 isoform X2 [Belonocnema kinseyi]